MLKTNLVDYMENHMVKRLELLPESMRMAEMTEEELGLRKRKTVNKAERKEADEEIISDQPERKDRPARKKPADKNAVQMKEEELELLLREFLS